MVYFETRYAPHLLMTSAPDASSSSSSSGHYSLGFEGVVEAVNAGLHAGQKEFGIRAKSILCCMRGEDGSQWAPKLVSVRRGFVFCLFTVRLAFCFFTVRLLVHIMFVTLSSSGGFEIPRRGRCWHRFGRRRKLTRWRVDATSYLRISISS